MNEPSLPQIIPIPNSRIKDITSQRFSRLVVLGFVGISAYGKALWLCECDCKKCVVIAGNKLRSGHSRSCGCLSIDTVIARSQTHGLRSAPEYDVWNAMIQRCSNPKNKKYADYGGRGITVCARWRRFENFYADMGKRPTSAYSLERIDNNAGYEPTNCRWATIDEQLSNQRGQSPTYLGRQNDDPCAVG